MGSGRENTPDRQIVWHMQRPRGLYSMEIIILILQILKLSSER